jgi:hypothetical protein
MSTLTWPQYDGVQRGSPGLLFRFLIRKRQLVSLLTVLGLLAIYIAGLLIRIPFVPPSRASAVDNWWFVTFLDLLFTGGAFGRGSVLALGTFAAMILGARIFKSVNFLVILSTRFVFLTLSSTLVIWIYRMHGMIRPGILVFATAVGCVMVGGIVLRFIHTQMIRLRGVAPLYVNLAIVLVLDVGSVLTGLERQHRHWEIGMVSFGLLVIAACGYSLLTNRVRITVESIKSVESRRIATLEFSAVSEDLLDAIGSLGMGLYVCLGALLSMAFNWRTVTEGNYFALVCVSVLAFALVWGIISTAFRLPNITEIIGGSGLLGFVSPKEYALRLVNNFWVLPRFNAGPQTELYLKGKLNGALRRCFLIFTVCFGVAAALHYILSVVSPGLMLFRFGPLASVFILLMLVGNVSMITKHAALGISQYRQLMRGHSRLMADAYLLGSTDSLSSLGLSSEAQQYWGDERISQQLRDMLDWLKVVRQMQIVKPGVEFKLTPKQVGQQTSFEIQLLKKEGPKRRWRETLMGLVQRSLAAAVVSVVVVVLCLLIWPDLGRKELGEIAVPILATTVIAPDMIMRLMKRPR